jgi:cell division septation protein DedD
VLRTVRLAVVVLCALLATAVAACSYSAGDLATSTTPAPPTAPRPTTTVFHSIVGTLPPITQPGQVAAPPVTAPPETTPAVTEAPPTTPAPATPASPKPTAKPRPTTAAPPARNSSPTTTVGVQAGAFTTKDAATQGLAALSAKGFAGFTVSGSGPFRLIRMPLSKQEADALVADLTRAGLPGLVFTPR